ncbi:Hsp70 family protein [Solwaraspora sp. WMMB335]|uniref:Hsp70 family protein n=1 Tax=Solwaraspora sp. WMMB335 TaxID=3404118 RepID=UPI003B93D39C
MSESPVPRGLIHVGIDVGTSNTAAAVRGRDGQVRPVLFDGVPLLPSAVFVDGDTVLVGVDAQQAATARPAHLEPNPKRCIDDRSVLLGEQEVTVEALLAAILRRVRGAAEQVAGPVGAVTLSYPAAWGSRRLATLTTAASLAGLPTPTTVHEPVAAAAHFVGLPGVDLPEGDLALVYDLGAGTFDATLIRRSAAGFEVVASQGLPDAGGLDIDATIVASIYAHLRPTDEAWQRLRHPRTPADLRNRRMLMDGVRAAKEVLSRTSSTSIYIPVLDAEVPLGREQFESLALPILDRTVTATRAVLRDAHVSEQNVAAIFLVGGSTRIPLVGTLLHRALGRPPIVFDQPELAVAYGAVADTAAVQSGAAVPEVASVPDIGRQVGSLSPANGTEPTAPAGPAGPAPSAESVTPPPLLPPPRNDWWRRAVRNRRSLVAAGLGLVILVTAAVAYPIVRDRVDGSGVNATGTTPTGQEPTNGVSSPATPTPTPSPSASVAPGPPERFIGQWSGTVRQPNGLVTSWDVRIALGPGTDVGTFSSTRLGCEGTITVVAPLPTEREVHLRQRTTRDPQSICVDAADWMLIARAPDSVDMYWTEFGDPTNTATAALTRTTG